MLLPVDETHADVGGLIVNAINQTSDLKPGCQHPGAVMHVVQCHDKCCWKLFISSGKLPEHEIILALTLKRIGGRTGVRFVCLIR